MQRVVTLLPLTELWDDGGPVTAVRSRDLTADDLRTLLHAGAVRFVVAEIAAPLRWVPVADCFRFWKEEVRPQLAGPAGADPGSFPAGYCYFASEWAVDGGPPVVVLAVAH